MAHRQEARERAPPAVDASRIKANIDFKAARIFHLRAGQFYDVTLIDPSRGELWFSTDAEVLAAG